MLLLLLSAAASLRSSDRATRAQLPASWLDKTTEIARDVEKYKAQGACGCEMCVQHVATRAGMRAGADARQHTMLSQMHADTQSKALM